MCGAVRGSVGRCSGDRGGAWAGGPRFEGRAALGGPPWAASVSASKNGRSERSTDSTSSSVDSAAAYRAASCRTARCARALSFGATKSIPSSICEAGGRAGGVGVLYSLRVREGPVGPVERVSRMGRGHVGTGVRAATGGVRGKGGVAAGCAAPSRRQGCALQSCSAAVLSPAAAAPSSSPFAATRVST